MATLQRELRSEAHHSRPDRSRCHSHGGVESGLSRTRSRQPAETEAFSKADTPESLLRRQEPATRSQTPPSPAEIKAKLRLLRRRRPVRSSGKGAVHDTPGNEPSIGRGAQKAAESESPRRCTRYDNSGGGVFGHGGRLPGPPQRRDDLPMQAPQHIAWDGHVHRAVPALRRQPSRPASAGPADAAPESEPSVGHGELWAERVDSSPHSDASGERAFGHGELPRGSPQRRDDPPTLAPQQIASDGHVHCAVPALRRQPLRPASEGLAGDVPESDPSVGHGAMWAEKVDPPHTPNSCDSSGEGEFGHGGLPRRPPQRRADLPVQAPHHIAWDGHVQCAVPALRRQPLQPASEGPADEAPESEPSVEHGELWAENVDPPLTPNSCDASGEGVHGHGGLLRTPLQRRYDPPMQAPQPVARGEFVQPRDAQPERSRPTSSGGDSRCPTDAGMQRRTSQPCGQLEHVPGNSTNSCDTPVYAGSSQLFQTPFRSEGCRPGEQLLRIHREQEGDVPSYAPHRTSHEHLQSAALQPRSLRMASNSDQHADPVRAAAALMDGCMPPPPNPAPDAAVSLLSQIPGAVTAGWREYTNPINGRTMFVNDVTYEEAKNLTKVAELMRKLQQREAEGIYSTGRRLSEVDTSGMDLMPCRFCSRKFNPQSIYRHEQICEKSTSKKHRMVL